MPIIPPRRIDGSDFSDWSEDSEDNGEIQKKVRRSFDEKRL